MPQSSGSAGTPATHERKLDGWGEIASYFRREIRTVQRWERNLGLPIHRLPVGRQSAVYAYPSELDQWYRERETKIKAEEIRHAADPAASLVEIKNHETPSALPPTPDLESNKGSEPRRLYWLSSIAVLLFAALLLSRFVLVPALFKPAAAIQPGGKLRLFVRPFQTVAGGTAESEFTDGLTSELNNRLGRLDPERLGVIAPTSS